jgi:hypothetical protein
VVVRAVLARAVALVGAVSLGLGAAATGAAAPAASAADPLCLGSYGGAPARVLGPLRFGIDPGLAGTAGGVQLPSAPDDPARDLEALQALRPPRRVLVLRLNRLFWSDGDAGIARFKAQATRDTKAGFDVELQVRYHPTTTEVGDIGAWEQYVRHVVDVFGPNPRVVAMTITNEVNIGFSPNTSDGAYKRADDALIGGIEAAHDEAVGKRYRQLRFGFTYAYRFSPTGDAALFSYLGAHGGAAFRAALGFVGLDFYPGSIFPPVMLPGQSYRQALAQALGVVRDCLAPKAGIPASVPIWITENGVPSACPASGPADPLAPESSGCSLSDAQQAAALSELVRGAYDYSGTYNVTDYRWFNLRDAESTGPETLVGATFASDGLLRDDYSHKPSFAAYRELIGSLGVAAKLPPPRLERPSHRPGHPHPHRHRHRHRHPHPHRRP